MLPPYARGGISNQAASAPDWAEEAYQNVTAYRSRAPTFSQSPNFWIFPKAGKDSPGPKAVAKAYMGQKIYRRKGLFGPGPEEGPQNGFTITRITTKIMITVGTSLMSR